MPCAHPLSFSNWASLCTTWSPCCLPSSSASAVEALARQLLVDGAAAAALAAQHLPAFGVNASAIRSVAVNSTAVRSRTNSSSGAAAYAIEIQMTVVLVGGGKGCGATYTVRG